MAAPRTPAHFLLRPAARLTVLALLVSAAVALPRPDAAEALREPFGLDLVLDLNQASGDAWPGVEDGAIIGDHFYFEASDAEHGSELWRTDGTTAGTMLVADILPGPSGSEPYYITAVDSRLYFLADDGVHGQEIWTSDGTAAGTHLVIDLQPGAAGVTHWGGFVGMGGIAYMAIDVGTSGLEPWRTDGTASGTYQVIDLNPGPMGSQPRLETTIGSTLYFTASDGTHGNELWRTTGTAGGTELVADISPGPAGSYPYPVTAIGNTLWFGASDGTTGSEVWRVVDGVPGATRVTDINPGAGFATPDGFTAYGGHVYFAAYEPTHGKELWRTDGGTTTLVADRHPTDSSSPMFLAVSAGLLFFTADDGVHGRELWQTNGATTGLVRDVAPGATGSDPTSMHDIGGRLVFTADDGTRGRELWRSDGTEGGTTIVTDLAPGATRYDTGSPVPFAGGALFRGDNGETGSELWFTGGTGPTTRLVRDIHTGTGHAFWNAYAVALGGHLYVAGDDGVHGTELWRTDGTAAGTTLVADVEPGPGGSDVWGVMTAGDRVYFMARTSAEGYGLWVSPEAGDTPTFLRSLPDPEVTWVTTQLGTAGTQAFFTHDDGVHGDELWASDGTVAGTRLVVDLRPGAAGSTPELQTDLGDQIFFVADDGTTGRELWVSDGSAAGTRQVADIQPGAGSSHPNWLGIGGGRVYFRADDGVHGFELWQVNESATGASLITDINPGGGSSYPQPAYDWAVRHELEDYWFTADDGTHGRELWRSDGTAAGTRLVADASPGAASTLVDRLVPMDGSWFFVGTDDAHGSELWRTDGTAAGTHLVADIVPGEQGGHPDELTVYDGLLFFTAEEPGTGREPWVSDGGDGTRLLQDVYPGPQSSGQYPEIGVAGDRLVMFLNTPELGAELWAVREFPTLIPEPGLTRWSGADRFGTAAEIAARVFPPGVETVFVATGLNFPDALTGGPAAAWHGAPILLVAPDAIPEATQVELDRLAPQRIVVLGGTQAVSEGVMAALGGSTTGSVERWSGPDRFATAAEISQRLVAPGAPRVYVATGLNFPDALTGGPPAAQDGAPILLVAPDAIPEPTAAELDRLEPAEIVVLGGTAAVSDAVMAALSDFTGGPVIRWSGPDRFATAAEVSAQSFPGDIQVAFATTGRNFPDALTGSAVAGQIPGPILLVTDSAIPDPTRTELERLRPVSIVVLGGEAAVGASVATELEAYLR